MARGGIIRPDVALDRTSKINGNRKEARARLRDALISGALRAVGQPVSYLPNEGKETLSLQDLTNMDPRTELGSEHYLNGRFWKQASAEDWKRADWTDGRFQSENGTNSYENVKFKESDVQQVIKTYLSQLKTPPEAIGRRPRAMAASKEEWVAALVSVAMEGRLVSKMKQADLLSEVSGRLTTWSLEEPPASTVGPVARKVLERLRSDPPTPPINITR